MVLKDVILKVLIPALSKCFWLDYMECHRRDSLISILRAPLAGKDEDDCWFVDDDI